MEYSSSNFGGVGTGSEKEAVAICELGINISRDSSVIKSNLGPNILVPIAVPLICRKKLSLKVK